MLSTIFVSAQDRILEAGISLENFDHFGLNFSWVRMWRFNWMHATNYGALTEDESVSEDQVTEFRRRQGIQERHIGKLPVSVGR